MKQKPKLHNYETGDFIREATQEELQASLEAAARDGGRGVIDCRIDGDHVKCYVED